LSALEEWTQSMVDKNATDEQIVQTVLTHGEYSEDDIENVLSKVHSTQNLQKQYLVNDETLEQLRTFVEFHAKEPVKKVIAELEENGWSPEFVESFVHAHRAN